MPEAEGAPHSRQTTAPGRPRTLLRIAYRHLAERGFDGLRVREVAREAGVTHGTLLYYFPTKEALIQAMVGQIVSEFAVSPLPEPGPDNTGALGELRREFADIQYRLHTTPEIFIALGELAIRARRDPAIARILHGMYQGWEGQLSGILERGIAEGVFRADLDVAETARAIRAQLMAIGYQALDPTDIAAVDRLVGQLAAQTEHWLTTGVIAPPTPPTTGETDR